MKFLCNYIFTFYFIVQSTRAIGTGRVGPRQTPHKNPFTVQQKDSFPTVNHFQHQQQQLEQQHMGQIDQYYDVISVPSIVSPISPRPFDGRPNLHERLNRHRQPIPSKQDYDATTGNNNNNSQASETAPIAVSY